MDLNLAITTVSDNHETNQLLLNAIKNKFSAQTGTEMVGFSPPNFNIPLLKVPGSASSQESTNIESDKNARGQENNAPTTTQLNQFLLKQLQERHKSNGFVNGQTELVVPNLNLNSKLGGYNPSQKKFELPILKETTNNINVSSLTKAIKKLQVDENPCDSNETNAQITSAIDLTTALASKLQSHQGAQPTRNLVKSKKLEDDIDFKIPFIDCDRVDISRKPTIILPNSNEYCITDISQLTLQYAIVEPSAIGRLLNIDDNKYSAPLPLKCLSAEFQQQSVKHKIDPFRFDTKSPDDLVLEALNKYQKRYHN